jgi:hypothetical protein
VLVTNDRQAESSDDLFHVINLTEFNCNRHTVPIIVFLMSDFQFGKTVCTHPISIGL